LIKGPNDYSIAQAKDAIRDGLRSVKNTIEDKAVVPGAGAFEIASHHHLLNFMREKVSGKVKLGVQCFADALLIIPRVLAENSGFDA
jgi:T-complex protein 1 subunit zeta